MIVSKSKRKKKTHKKGKNSGESTKVNGSAEATGEENGGEDDEELDLRNADILKEDSQGEEEGLTNATKYQNGAPNGTSEELGDKAEEVGEEDPHLSLPSRDATQKLDALAKERDALRAEVTELHKSLEQIQEKHAEEASNLQAQLKEIQQGKEHAETQYKTLLGKVNTIRSQLGERLKADAEELSRARAEIDELNDANRNMRANSDTLHSTVSRLSTENESQAREISDLRSRTSLSQQNWVKERDDLISREAYAKDEFANAKQAMQDWEVLALEERNMRENLQGKVEDLEERVQTQRDEVGRLRMERDMQTQTVDGLQRALQDLQDGNDPTLRCLRLN
ncbi:MAG: hypothetical protein M1822_001485 [Bathelium mastoideum]|nr:MAG: hypothetical protein M1822_001485 [Bathelium mastoideum]